jgi:type I restriction enzyme M protein
VKLRRFLVEDSLVAVVSLPAGVFKPYSGVKTSILLLDKKLARQTKEILFLKITADGFDLGDKRNPIEANDLPEAERVVKAWFAGKLNELATGSVAWKAVEKKTLLEDRTANLVVEPHLGEGPEVGVSSFVNVADLLREVKLTNKIQKTQFLPSGRFPIVDQSENFIAGYWNDEADVFRVTEPLVLFGDHTRRFKYVDFDFVLGADGVKVLRFDERVLPRYAYFALSALKLRDLGYSRHYKELLGHEIPLPPLEEQRRIVAEIEGYQKVLDGARQILAGWQPRVEVDAEWETLPLGDVCVKCKQVSPTTLGRASFRYIDIDSVDNTALRITNPKPTPASDAPSRARKLVKGGDVLFSTVRPYLKNIAVVPPSLDGEIASTGFGVIRADEQRALPKFLFAAVSDQRFVDAANALTSGASYPAITESQLFEIEIPLPPMSEQRRLVAELDAEAAQMEAVRALLPRFEAKIQRVLDRVWGTPA